MPAQPPDPLATSSDGPPSAAPPLTIAIDGPAASGKGTLARALAERYGLPHLDTGLTYRAVAKAMLDAGDPLDDEARAIARADALDLGGLERGVLSRHEIGDAASRVAAMPGVRRALVRAQRRFAASGAGAVLDGRDIGTVVLPEATVKLFVTATPEMRARRRYDETVARGRTDTTFMEVLEDLKRRDARDAGREDSPMRAAEDAHLLDTTELSIATALERAAAHVDAARSAAGHAPGPRGPATA